MAALRISFLPKFSSSNFSRLSSTCLAANFGKKSHLTAAPCISGWRVLPIFGSDSCSVAPSAVLSQNRVLHTSFVPRFHTQIPFCNQQQQQQHGERSPEIKDEDGEFENYKYSGIINRLKYHFRFHPLESVVSLLTLEISSIYVVYSFINVVGLEVSPEFALAFALSRPFRRFRLPLELVVASQMAKIFPRLTELQIADLFVRAFAPASVVSDMNSVTPRSALQRGMLKIQSVVNKYGAAYFLSSRFLGVVIVFGMYEGLRLGLDVTPLLEMIGIKEVGSVLGTWAAAVTLSSALYPFTLSLSAFLAPILVNMRSIWFRK